MAFSVQLFLSIVAKKAKPAGMPTGFEEALFRLVN